MATNPAPAAPMPPRPAPAAVVSTAPAVRASTGDLEVRDLNVIYGGAKGVHALQDVSLSIKQGDFVVALGASGCGKTTFLNVMAGFIHPTPGEVLLDGRPIQGPGRDRGVVFQKHALLPWLNVLDNVCFGLKLQGVPQQQREDVGRRYLSLVGLSGFERHKVYQLSGGMQQRVGNARMVKATPEFIKMREAVLDIIYSDEREGGGEDGHHT